MGLITKKPIKKEEQIKDMGGGARSVLFWGSPDSGKSVISTLIAKKLAERYKTENVVLIYADEITPVMNCFFPSNSFETIESLGSLYTPIKITEDLIYTNLTSFKKLKNLGLLGFKNCENYAQYPECSEDLAQQLLRTLKNLFDYVIIDGSSAFIYNQLTSVSFNEVDVCFRVCTQELKSASYFGSNEAFLDTVNVNVKKEQIILNKIDQRGVYDEVFNNANGYNYLLNLSNGLKDIVEKGNLLLDINDSKFDDELDKIIREVF